MQAMMQTTSYSGFERVLAARQEWHKEPVASESPQADAATEKESSPLTLTYVLPCNQARVMRICKNVISTAQYAFSELGGNQLICINRKISSSKPRSIEIRFSSEGQTDCTRITLSADTSSIGALRVGLHRQHLERLVALMKQASIVSC